MKQLLSGNEAVARGIYEAGVKVCSAYPGTPSTEILENVAKYKDEIYAEWAPNEKVATEMAYGAAIAGSRSFCAMKMVGLNVAADPMFTAGYMGVTGGFVILTADDPSMHSSQNEQDNRYYARAAKIALVEPSDSQECKDFIKVAYEISEKFDTPVLFRTTTRINHSKSLVEFGTRTEHVAPEYHRNVRKYVCVPANARKNHPQVEERLRKLAEYGNTCGLNRLEMKGNKIGVITSGVSYEYAKEIFPEDTSFLKLGLTFPLPMDLIRKFAGQVEDVFVVEELEPFLEDQIRAAGIPCHGKERTGRMFEYNTALLRERIFGEKPEKKTPAVKTAVRPAALCPGCPHRGFFYTLSKNPNYVVTGDIGCYTLGAAPPLGCMDTAVCMGGGLSVGMGMSKSFEQEGVTSKKVFGVVGDSTFFHSGISPLINAVHNKHNFVLTVLDNRITAMTGGQPNPGIPVDGMGDEAPEVSIRKLALACGCDYVRVINPFNLEQVVKTYKEAFERDDAAVIISKAPCTLIKGLTRKPPVKLVESNCNNCDKCVSELACPAISKINGKITIDEAQCDGCSACIQVCKYGALEDGR